MMIGNNQEAFEYAVYMIVGSFFRKAECASMFQEKRMRLKYREMKPEKQYGMEDICINFAEKNLKHSFSERLWNNEVKVRFAETRDGRSREVRFYGPEYILTLKGDYKGKNTRLVYSLRQNKDELSENSFSGSVAA